MINWLPVTMLSRPRFCSCKRSWGRLQGQGDVLNKQADKLQEKNPRRAQEITQLEEENSDLDDRTQKAEGAIKSIQESLDAGYQEDQKLLLQLKGMANVLHLLPCRPNPRNPKQRSISKKKN